MTFIKKLHLAVSAAVHVAFTNDGKDIIYLHDKAFHDAGLVIGSTTPPK
jgi:hypothetical protein